MKEISTFSVSCGFPMNTRHRVLHCYVHCSLASAVSWEGMLSAARHKMQNEKRPEQHGRLSSYREMVRGRAERLGQGRASARSAGPRFFPFLCFIVFHVWISYSPHHTQRRMCQFSLLFSLGGRSFPGASASFPSGPISQDWVAQEQPIVNYR